MSGLILPLKTSDILFSINVFSKSVPKTIGILKIILLKD